MELFFQQQGIDPTTLNALIGFAGVILTVIVGAWVQMRRYTDGRILEIERELSQIRPVFKIIQEVYVEDVLKRSREAGLVKENSPMQPTDKLKQIWGDALTESIQNEIDKERYSQGDYFDLANHVYFKFKEQIIVKIGDGRLPVHYGAILHLARHAKSVAH